MQEIPGNYWKDFSPIWWDEIKLWYGWTDWINAMYRTGIQIGSIILVFILGRGAENFFDSVIVKVAEWCLTILLLQFALTITYLRASRKLYGKQKDTEYEQKGKIVRLEKRSRTGTPIKTAKITISPRDELGGDQNGFHYAFLEVENGEDNDLLDCYANLTSIKAPRSDGEEKDPWGEYIDWIKGNTNELTWPKFNSIRDEKRIRRKSKERINVAKYKDGTHNQEPIFIFADGAERSSFDDKVYIEVRLNGEMQKNNKRVVIEEILFTGFLRVYRGSYEQEGATITTTRDGETYTEVEPTEKKFYSRLIITPGVLKHDN